MCLSVCRCPQSTMPADGVGGCVNKAFEGADDGFHTIDLRTGRRDDEHHTRTQVNELSILCLL